MINLQTQPAVLTFTVTITRKDTGKVEIYNMIGTELSNKEEQKTLESK